MGRDPTRHGYRKGDNKAGGGGTSGGGGKRGRAPHGWEKADQLRDFSAVREEVDFPRKPGSPHHPPRSAGRSLAPALAGATLMDVLRSMNAKVLTTLRKLEATSTSDTMRRQELCTALQTALSKKREAEAQLFPLLLDHPEAQEGIASARELQDELDSGLRRLLTTDPADREFKLQVRVLYGLVQQQIETEHHGVLDTADRVIPADEASELAHRLGYR